MDRMLTLEFAADKTSAETANPVLVEMWRGEGVETGLADQIFQDPQHPYTQQLVHAKL